MSIRIILVDDHGILRDGLQALIMAEPGYEVVGEAGDGLEAIQLVAQLLPDLVLMDISMPNMGGIEATRRIKAANPAAKILFLTVHEDKGFLQEALQAGGSGLILKRALKNDLFNAIRTIVNGGVYLHPSLLTTLAGAQSFEVEEKEDQMGELTPREIDVLKLLAQGYTNMQIADQLMISARTVQFHRGNINEKLHLHSRVDLVQFAVQNHLVQF